MAYFILSLISTGWQFVFGIFCVDCFNRTAIRQVTRIRTKYFESLMRQNIAWYDIAAGKTNFSIRITEYVILLIEHTINYIHCVFIQVIVRFRDIDKIKMGLAEDVSHFMNLMFSFVICAVISFIYGWKLTLIVISYLPLVFAANIIIGKVSVLVFKYLLYFVKLFQLKSSMSSDAIQVDYRAIVQVQNVAL